VGRFVLRVGHLVVGGVVALWQLGGEMKPRGSGQIPCGPVRGPRWDSLDAPVR
jgi:hypothetical protein